MSNPSIYPAPPLNEFGGVNDSEYHCFDGEAQRNHEAYKEAREEHAVAKAKHFDMGCAMESHREWEEQDAGQRAAVAELCEAEQSHHVYGAAELALKDAIQSLEVLLLRYSERFGDPAQLWRLTSPDYQYTQELFAPCLAALKEARKFNEARGEPTSLLVDNARAKLNPEIHRQAKEQTQEAERATRFCSNFLNWISKYEAPVTGETK